MGLAKKDARTRSSVFTFERSGEDTWPGGGGDCWLRNAKMMHAESGPVGREGLVRDR